MVPIASKGGGDDDDDYLEASVDVKVVVVVRIDKAELLLALLLHAEEELVKDVEVTLLRSIKTQ